MWLDDHPRSGRNLTGANIRDSVNGGEAVGAIATQAEAATVGGALARTQQGDERRITSGELQRPSLKDELHV
jgi:hypothetical protein